MKTSYHHGDLRDTLIEAALKLIQQAGVEALSMRKLAEKVGVSRSAPYHHFRDKRELLSAIAEAGFFKQDKIFADLGDSSGRERLARFIHHYVDFATSHREQYDLMYGREIWRLGTVTSSLDLVAKRSFKTWLSEVERLQSIHIFPNSLPAVRVAQVSWAALHGLCRLVNDGIYINREDIGSMQDALIDILMQGRY